MSATDTPAHGELSTPNRLVRFVIGTAAFLSELLFPELSEGWVFVLAVFSIYACQTAFYNIEPFHAFFTLPDADEIPNIEEDNSDELRSIGRIPSSIYDKGGSHNNYRSDKIL